MRHGTQLLLVTLGACLLSLTGCGENPPKYPQRIPATRPPVPGGLEYLEDERAHKPFVPEVPKGIYFDEDLIPEDNPMTPAKVELGRQLYFDPNLSRDRSVSCASCHNPALGWADGAPTSAGIRGQRGGRSAPTVMNRALAPVQFWDGRAATLEEQAVGPVGNPIEMGFTIEEAAERLNGMEVYRVQFEKIFDGPATPDRIGMAIATFERTVLVGGAPNDYYEEARGYLEMDAEEISELDAEDKAQRDKVLAAWEAHKMSPSAQRGREIYFNKGRCSLCHVGPNLADELYHNLGVGMDGKDPDLGRYVVTKKDEDRGAFKTPTLRNIKDTAPYMHDGSERTLMDVVRFYNKGGNKNRWLSPKIQPLGLTEKEMQDLVRFMEEGLQGELAKIPQPPAGAGD